MGWEGKGRGMRGRGEKRIVKEGEWERMIGKRKGRGVGKERKRNREEEKSIV